MPRIKSVRVAPFDEVQGIADDAAMPIGHDYAADVARAVEEDHYCEDSTCDVHHALKAGAPISAACILIGATECAHVTAVRAAHAFNRTLTDWSANLYAAPDWPIWLAYHEENGRHCGSCGSFTYDGSEECGNCLADL